MHSKLLENNKWTNDVPDMNKARFSMTMLFVDSRWIYSFGGATEDLMGTETGLEIERLEILKEG